MTGFTALLTCTRGSRFTLKLSDTTEGWSHTVTKTLSGAARTSAEVIAEAPCCTDSGGILPVADFTKVGFTSGPSGRGGLTHTVPQGRLGFSAAAAENPRRS